MPTKNQHLNPTDDNTYTVRGWLDRVGKGGKPEHIDMTPAEVKAAPSSYTPRDLVNIHIELSNGTIVRPYRFAETMLPGEIQHYVDDDGNDVGSF